MWGLQQLGRGVAVALQVAAAAMWVLPQSASGAAVRLVMPLHTGPLWWQVTSSAKPGSGDARIILAQTTGGGGGGGKTGGQSGSTGGGSDPDPTPQAITPDATAKFVQQFNDVSDFCRLLDLRYRIDCLQAHFEKISRSLPTTGDYAPLRAALAKAAIQLDRVVEANKDSGGKIIAPRLRSKPQAERIRPLTPILPARQAAANAAAAAVVDELSTVLLRSALNSERRQIAFQAIATAIDGTAVLLRSS